MTESNARPTRVLDLFSGLGGWSEAFVAHGYDVTRVEMEPRFSSVPRTVQADVLTWEPDGPYDLVLASPPCEGFSVAALGHNWRSTWPCRCGGSIERVGKHRGGDRANHCDRCASPVRAGQAQMEPMTDTARVALALVERTLALVEQVGARWWWMENPRAMLRRVMEQRHPDIPRATITFCHYGENRMKPTDLWGRWPSSWSPQPACRNGDPCHEAAPRGSRTGTQGIKGSAARALLPYALSDEVRVAVERADRPDPGAWDRLL